MVRVLASKKPGGPGIPLPRTRASSLRHQATSLPLPFPFLSATSQRTSLLGVPPATRLLPLEEARRYHVSITYSLNLGAGGRHVTGGWGGGT